MGPHSSRVNHYTVDNRQAEFVAVVERIVPRALERVETTSLYLLLCVMWGFVFFAMVLAAQ